MQDNTSQPTSGTDRFAPGRGRAGYVQRQSSYYSSGQPIPSSGSGRNQASQPGLSKTPSSPDQLNSFDGGLPSVHVNRVTTSTITTPPSTQAELSSDRAILRESSQAAQRIVGNPSAPKPLPHISSAANYGGSFDILPAKTVASAQKFAPEPFIPALQQPSSALAVASVPATPVQPELVATYLTQTTTPIDQILPTDLLAPIISESGSQEQSKKTRKQMLSLPKITTPKVLVGMAVALFVAGGMVSFLGLKTNKDVQAQVKSVSKTQTTKDSEGGMAEGVPDEDGDAPSVEYYRTPATYPRVIRIAKTNTEARVLALGIAKTGALKAPGNIFDAGWHKESAKPGEAGAMVVDGHVSGPTKPGVFKNLGKLAAGDKIDIERGDGQTFTYTVQATKVFDADKLEMSGVMVPYVPGKPGLNIITCAGKYNSETSKYEQRTVVYAVII